MRTRFVAAVVTLGLSVALAGTLSGCTEVKRWFGDDTTGPPPPPVPVAAFTGTPTSGVVPLTVSFADQSTGVISSWSWTFGDGDTSTEQNPNHTYANSGTFTVSLTVTGPGGSNTLTRPNYITAVPVEPPPVADFVGSPTSGSAPLLVNFTDQSTGSVTSWDWDFGDGNTSTAQNPSNTYQEGTYTVTLTVTGPGGSSTLTRTDYITAQLLNNWDEMLWDQGIWK